MEINLFEKRLKKLSKKLKLRFLLTRSIVFWVLVMGVLMIIISGWSLLINRSNIELNQNIKAIEKKINALVQVESQQVYLTSKLSTFRQLIKTQEVHQAITETVFALIPSGTELKGFKVETEGVIKLSGTVPNYITLERLLSRIKNPEEFQLPLKAAKVNRIVVSKEGSISFDIDLTIEV